MGLRVETFFGFQDDKLKKSPDTLFICIVRNLIIINKLYLSKYGYFHIFKYKWGFEHLLLMNNYLKNTEYLNLVLLELKNYIFDVDVIHQHCNNNIDYFECIKNLEEGLNYGA